MCASLSSLEITPPFVWNGQHVGKDFKIISAFLYILLLLLLLLTCCIIIMKLYWNMDSVHCRLQTRAAFGYGGHTFLNASSFHRSCIIFIIIVRGMVERHWNLDSALQIRDASRFGYGGHTFLTPRMENVAGLPLRPLLLLLDLLLERSRQAWHCFGMRWRLLLQRKIRLF